MRHDFIRLNLATPTRNSEAQPLNREDESGNRQTEAWLLRVAKPLSKKVLGLA